MNARWMTFLLPLVIACSGPASSEEDADTEDELTSGEAANQLGFRRSVLTGERASGRAQGALGISTWDVWAVQDRDVSASVLFALDDENQVKYAVLIAKAAIVEKERAPQNRGQVVVLKYDANGPTDAKIDADTAAILTGEFQLLKTKVAESRGDCARALASIALGVAGLGIAYWVVAPIVAGSAAFTLLSAGRLAVTPVAALFTTGLWPETLAQAIRSCPKVAIGANL